MTLEELIYQLETIKKEAGPSSLDLEVKMRFDFLMQGHIRTIDIEPDTITIEGEELIIS